MFRDEARDPFSSSIAFMGHQFRFVGRLTWSLRRIQYTRRKQPTSVCGGLYADTPDFGAICPGRCVGKCCLRNHSEARSGCLEFQRSRVFLRGASGRCFPQSVATSETSVHETVRSRFRAYLRMISHGQSRIFSLSAEGHSALLR